MKASAVYRKAAEVVANHLYARGEHYCACEALSKVCGYSNATLYQEQFHALFMPDDGASLHTFWFGEVRGEGHQENRKDRVLALLLMSEIAKDEEAA